MEKPSYYAFKIVWGLQASFGGKSGGWCFLSQKSNNFTLFLFIRHVCLGVETQGEAWSVSWGTGRGNKEKKAAGKFMWPLHHPPPFSWPPFGKVPLPRGCRRAGWWYGAKRASQGLRVGLGNALLVRVPVKTGLSPTDSSHKLYSPGRSPCPLSTPGSTRHNLYAPTQVSWLWWI